MLREFAERQEHYQALKEALQASRTGQTTLPRWLQELAPGMDSLSAVDQA